MYRIITACALFSLVAAAVIRDESQAQIVKYQNNNDGVGNYEFSFETSNGITREETGRLVDVGTENEHMVVEGSYSYIDVDGKPVVVRYKADEDGYRVIPQVLEPIVVYGLPPSVVATLLGK